MLSAGRSAGEPKPPNSDGSIFAAIGTMDSFDLARKFGVAIGLNAGEVQILVAWRRRPPERPALVPA